jgi:hypothetical protein
MLFLRRVMKVPCTARISNDVILKQLNKEKWVIMDGKKEQSEFIRHVLRKGTVGHTVTTGKVVGKQDRGRQQENYWIVLQNGKTED